MTLVAGVDGDSYLRWQLVVLMMTVISGGSFW